MSVSDVTAVLAAISSTASLVLCLWLPQKRFNLISTGVYLLVVLLVSVLISTSGGVSSPFTAAWLLVAIFAGFFGVVITGLMGLLLIVQIFISYISHSSDIPDILTHLFFGLIPIALGFVLWHRQPHKKSDRNNTLSDLASRLSTVEGKSDVVINSIDDGVMAINRSGIIDLINPSAQTLVGWNKGDALGLDWRSVLKLVSEDGREVLEIDNPIAKALATNKPTHEDKLFLTTGSGKKRLVSIVSSPVGSSNDGIIVIFRDIAKEKAEEREQAEFISTASHEMRTPVASIEGYLGLALNPTTATIDDKARDFITKAHESARYLGRLFQDLLDISRAEEGRLKNEPHVIDVSSSVGGIFEGLGKLAADKNLRFIFKPNPSLETGSERRLQPVYYAEVDPSHFREVVSNLIENAIKYTPRGEVIVDILGDEKVLTISIQDTGIGIPPEDIPHLFQKFYRVDNTDTREIGGTGLGLFLCRRLTEIMGGHLRVESTYHKGSTFYLDIPRISHEEAMRKIQLMSDESNLEKVNLESRSMLSASDNIPEQMNVTAAPVTDATLQHAIKLDQSDQPPAQPEQQPELQQLPPQPDTANFSPLSSDSLPNPYIQQPIHMQAAYPAMPAHQAYTAMSISEIEASVNSQATPQVSPMPSQPPYVARQQQIVDQTAEPVQPPRVS